MLAEAKLIDAGGTGSFGKEFVGHIIKTTLILGELFIAETN